MAYPGVGELGDAPTPAEHFWGHLEVKGKNKGGRKGKGKGKKEEKPRGEGKGEKKRKGKEQWEIEEEKG